MAAAVVSDDGEKRLLARLIAGWTVVIRLYRNDYAPTTGDTGAEYLPASFPGYAPITALNWIPPETDATGAAFSTSDLCVFTRASGAPSSAHVYGYYATDATGGYLWGQRDDGAPYDVSAEGATYVVYPCYRHFNYPP